MKRGSVRAAIPRASSNRLDIHLLLLERRVLSVAECILSRADLYQSRIIEPNVAISANRMAETISPVMIALLLMTWVFQITEGRRHLLCVPVVRWLKRHGLCRCCDRQGEHYTEEPHYSFLLVKSAKGRKRQLPAPLDTSAVGGGPNVQPRAYQT